MALVAPKRRSSALARAALAVISALLLAGLGQPVSATTLARCYAVPGRIADTYGTGIAGATVTVAKPCDDQPASATTDASGNYTVHIKGDVTGASSAATAGRRGYVPSTQTITVSPISVASASTSNASESPSAGPGPSNSYSGNDFSLLFDPGASLSPTALRSGTAVNFSASNPAPPAQAKVLADLPDGTTTQLSAGTTDAEGFTTWTGSYAVVVGTGEATYTVRFCIVDRAVVGSCAAAQAAGQLLSSLIARTYVVDDTPPVIDPRSLTPLDFGNTIFTAQPLLARVSDNLAGVDPAAVSFVLRNETTGTEATYAGSATALPQLIRANPAPLTVGHVYRITVQATDRAGNARMVAQTRAANGGGFLVTTITTLSTTARIPPTPCTVSDQVDLATGTRTATCENVPLDFDPTSLTLGGNRHPVDDIAFVEHTAPLDSAVLKTTIAGVDQTQSAYPSGTTRTGSLRYGVPARFQVARTLTVEGSRKNLGTLTTRVPATWTAATLEMPGVTTTASAAACADPTTSSVGVSCVPDPALHRYLVVLQGTVADPGAVAQEHSARHRAEVRFTYRLVLRGYAAFIPLSGARQISQDSRVRSVSRDFEVSGPPFPDVVPEEISLPQQVVPTGVGRVGATSAWSRGHKGQGIRVAVLDTGIDRDHPDLVDNVEAVFDCWPILSAADLEVPVQPAEPARDLHGHGTHVAGTIAAVDNPNNPFGVVGVASGARIHAVKVLNDIGRGTQGSLICGLEYVRERAPTTGVASPIRVTNASIWGQGGDLGNCGGGLDELHGAICEVVGAGVSVVSIAGNAGTDGREFANVADYVPGAYDEVITATALADSDALPCGLGEATARGGDDTFADFSNFAEAVDQPHVIAAPGVRILSTVRRVQGLNDPNRSYAHMSGTSMAAPHISGAAALFIARELAAGRAAPSPAAVVTFLRDNGEPLGVSFRNECTSGGVSHSDPRGWGNSEPVVRVDGI